MQVEVGTPPERAAVGSWGGARSVLLDLCENEMIEFFDRPLGVFYSGHLWFDDRAQ